MNRKKQKRNIVSIILAAGKGTRMRTVHMPKVCFPIEGKPVIARAIETYQSCGIHSHFIVVNYLAEQVMQATVGLDSNIFFSYQNKPIGTGNAAKSASQLLSSMKYHDDILVVAGDKIFDNQIIDKLIDHFYDTESDLSFLVSEADNSNFAGRVLYSKEAEPVAVVEAFDVGKIKLLQTLNRITKERPLSSREANLLALDYLGNEKKAAFALGSVWDSVNEGYSVTSKLIHENFSEQDFIFSINNERFDLPQLLKSSHQNLSTYIFKAEALYFALDRLTRDNAQQEEYLTETISILSNEKFKISTVSVDHKGQVLDFNTPEELEEVRKAFVSKSSVQISSRRKLERNARHWLKDFDLSDPQAISNLAENYGDGHTLLENKRKTLISLLTAFIREYGDVKTVITRSSGRINMMGRHVDHQGGYGNMIALDKDIFCVAGERTDDQINILNLDSRLYAVRQFSIKGLVKNFKNNWIEFVNSDQIIQQAREAQGDWSQYIKAISARIQTLFPGKKLKGLNLAFGGDIPIAAGLSSSSALVVATAKAIISINNLKISSVEFVNLCAEAEWYVGTRGGAGDHAAMTYCKKGAITQIGYFPVHEIQNVSFPDDYALIVCNSLEKARKTAGAKDIFNHRVACYNIARELFKKMHSKFSSKIEYLRDINSAQLNVSNTNLITMIKDLPVSLNRNEIENYIGYEKAREYLNTHSDQINTYPIRNVLLFGLGEIERSRIFARSINAGNINEAGKMMNISHNGDRIMTYSNNGEPVPFNLHYTDDQLKNFFDNTTGNKNVMLQNISGSYGCSSAKIDRMIDIALSVKGTIGAQIAGAGLGGCIMVLMKNENTEDLYKMMTEKYYQPAELDPEIFICNPAQGSSLLEY